MSQNYTSVRFTWGAQLRVIYTSPMGNEVTEHRGTSPDKGAPVRTITQHLPMKWLTTCDVTGPHGP